MMAIFVPAPPSHIIIAGGPKGGSYEQYAMKYREILARSHVKVDVLTTDGAGENLKLLEDSTSGVVAGFALGGIAKGVKAPDVKSLGRVKYTAVFVFYRASERLTDLAELKSKRIDLSVVGRLIGVKVPPQEIAAHQEWYQDDGHEEEFSPPLWLFDDGLERSFRLRVFRLFVFGLLFLYCRLGHFTSPR
jgi:hypothetical protein